MSCHSHGVSLPYLDIIGGVEVNISGYENQISAGSLTSGRYFSSVHLGI